MLGLSFWISGGMLVTANMAAFLASFFWLGGE